MDNFTPIEVYPITSLKPVNPDKDMNENPFSQTCEMFSSPLGVEFQPFDEVFQDYYDEGKTNITTSVNPLGIVPYTPSNESTTSPLDRMVNPGAIVPYVGSNNNSYDAHDDVPSTSLTKPKRGSGRPKGSPSKKKLKVPDPKRKLVKSCPNFDSGITEKEKQKGYKELVDSVLIRFDALRRRFKQLGDVPGPVTSAQSNCTQLEVRTNWKKRIGPVPGVEVGDIFYNRVEMCLAGLHIPSVPGIDYFGKKDAGKEGCVATSVVTSGCYDDSTSDVDSLVYTGHGGKPKDGAPCGQKLEKGNLALQASHEKGTDVRIIRGLEDPHGSTNKIFIYDGLYKVKAFTKRENAIASVEFKYHLARKSGQPSGYAIWKELERLNFHGLDNPRKGLVLPDICLGRENLPVPVVNEFDEEDKSSPPAYFEYQKSSLDSFTDRPPITCSNCIARSCSSKDENFVRSKKRRLFTVRSTTSSLS